MYTDDYNCGSILSEYGAYDIVSGKLLRNYIGYLKSNKRGICTGKVFNTVDRKIYNHSSKGVSKSNASSLIICHTEIEQNSVGGVDYTIRAINNSSKEIKYVYRTVYVLNRVNDMVSDEVTGDYYFKLKDTGPYKSCKTTGGTWENIMYNYSASKVESL